MQTNASPLCDPEALAANTRGEVTASQRQAIRARLRGQGNDWFRFILSICIIGFIIYEHRLFGLLFLAKDPLPSQEHIWRWTITIPGLHVLLTLIVGSWALVLLGGIRRLIHRVRAIRELRPGHVRYADGTIIWHGDGYIARIPHRHDALTPWDLRPIDNLLPGTYRCWFLPLDGWLLAVQQLDIPQHGEPASLYEALARSNGFRPDALAANRAGRLSETQIRAFARSENRAEWWQLAISIGLLALAPVFWYIGDLYPALCALGAGLYSFIQLLRKPAKSLLDRDIAAGQIVVREGICRKHHERKFSLVGAIATEGEGGSTDSYFYLIGDERFPVSDRAYHALVEGIPYRVYSLPRCKQLINMEPLTPHT